MPSRMTWVVVLAVCVLALGASYWAWPRADVSGNDPSIVGVWQITTYEPAIKPMDGGAIPFTPAGLAAYEKNVTGLQDGTVADFAVTLCVPPGVVRAMATPDPFEIVVTPEVVAVIIDGFHYLVRMNEEYYAEDIEFFPAFMGHHIGHWDGDTLVIDTRGFNPHTWLDASGVPHGYDLYTVQHIRKIDGGQLENVITIEDDEFFTRPWSVRYVYEPHRYVSMATGAYPCDDRGVPSRYVYEREFRPPY